MHPRTDARQGGSQGEEDTRSGGPPSNSANAKTGLGKPSPVAQITSSTKMAAVRGFRIGHRGPRESRGETLRRVLY